MLRHRYLERVTERSFRTRAPIGEHSLEAANESIDQGCVEARLRKVQVDQLQHRIDVALRGITRDAFAQVVYRWIDAHLLPGQIFLEIDDGELADSARGRDQVRRTGGDEGGVGKK